MLANILEDTVLCVFIQLYLMNAITVWVNHKKYIIKSMNKLKRYKGALWSDIVGCSVTEYDQCKA